MCCRRKRSWQNTLLNLIRANAPLSAAHTTAKPCHSNSTFFSSKLHSKFRDGVHFFCHFQICGYIEDGSKYHVSCASLGLVLVFCRYGPLLSLVPTSSMFSNQSLESATASPTNAVDTWSWNVEGGGHFLCLEVKHRRIIPTLPDTSR